MSLAVRVGVLLSSGLVGFVGTSLALGKWSNGAPQVRQSLWIGIAIALALPFVLWLTSTLLSAAYYRLREREFKWTVAKWSGVGLGGALAVCTVHAVVCWLFSEL